MRERLILGLDCGQTSCKACLVTLDGEVLALGRGGAMEHLSSPTGLTSSGESVIESLQDLRRKLGDHSYEVVLASIGFSGGLSPDREHYMREWVCSVFPVVRLLIAGDAVVNLAGAGEVSSQTVVVIAGGGSIAWATGPDGKEIASGGWSHAFGDEGSGWQIGRSAVIAALRASDGRGPTTLLEDAIARHFGLPEVGGIKELYYSHRIGDPDLARLVPLVVTAAESGDQVALGILAEAGRELGLAAAAIIRRLGWRKGKPEVVATGGVFKAGGVLWDHFCITVRAAADQAEIRRARFDPVIGAVLIGLKDLNITITAALCDRLELSLQALQSRE